MTAPDYPNYEPHYSYDELFSVAINAGITVAEMLSDASVEPNPDKREETCRLADLVLKGGQIMATLALAKATRGDAPARPKLRGL